MKPRQLTEQELRDIAAIPITTGTRTAIMNALDKLASMRGPIRYFAYPYQVAGTKPIMDFASLRNLVSLRILRTVYDVFTMLLEITAPFCYGPDEILVLAASDTQRIIVREMRRMFNVDDLQYADMVTISTMERVKPRIVEYAMPCDCWRAVDVAMRSPAAQKRLYAVRTRYQSNYVIRFNEEATQEIIRRIK